MPLPILDLSTEEFPELSEAEIAELEAFAERLIETVELEALLEDSQLRKQEQKPGQA